MGQLIKRVPMDERLETFQSMHSKCVRPGRCVSLASAMLSRQVCVKTSFLAASYVSTVNSLLRMLVSLAPYLTGRKERRKRMGENGNSKFENVHLSVIYNTSRYFLRVRSN